MAGYCCRQCEYDAEPNMHKLMRMFIRMNHVCKICGDRECRHAADHRSPCQSPWMATPAQRASMAEARE